MLLIAYQSLFRANVAGHLCGGQPLNAAARQVGKCAQSRPRTDDNGERITSSRDENHAVGGGNDEIKPPQVRFDLDLFAEAPWCLDGSRARRQPFADRLRDATGAG